LEELKEDINLIMRIEGQSINTMAKKKKQKVYKESSYYF
jgi:hypothetical protein